MKNIIIFITVLLAAICSGSISAQEIIHEYSVYGSGGLSSLRYELPLGSRNGGGGGEFGLGYTYMVHKERAVETGKIYQTLWGVHTGIGFGFYGAKATISDGSNSIVSEGHVDIDNDIFNLHTTLSGYSETQRAAMLIIPVMGQYHIDQYYVMGGFKFGFPIGGNFKSENATFTNQAYYPKYDIWLRTQQFAGYGSVPAPSRNDKYSFSMAMMFSLEGGMKWTINSNFTLYSGLYLDVGLNNIHKKDNLKLVEYTQKADVNTPAVFTTNSALSAHEEKVNLLAVGVKVRLAYTK